MLPVRKFSDSDDTINFTEPAGKSQPAPPMNSSLALNIRQVTALALLLLLGKADAQVITMWTFETSQPSLTNSATISGILAEIGTGTASGVHASSATDWTNPAGNRSAESFSSNNWAIGDYFQFEAQITLADVTPLNVSWHQTRSAQGPDDFKLQVQVNGGGFSDVLNINNLAATNWSSSGGAFQPTILSTSIGSIGAGSHTIQFRVIATGAPGDEDGTSRIDNFTLSAVPEPSTYAMLLGVAALGFVGYRRFRMAHA